MSDLRDQIEQEQSKDGAQLGGLGSPIADLFRMIGRIATAGGGMGVFGGGQSAPAGTGQNNSGAGGTQTGSGSGSGSGTSTGGSTGTNTGTGTNTTPQIDDLQPGDKDADHVWNGVSYPDHNGTYVHDLQTKLKDLGYWVSGPSSEHGMNCDGDYGVSTTGAVATFQLEAMAIDANGDIDETLVTGIYDEATRTALDALTTRPSHKAKNVTGNVQFVQLQPNVNFTRYSPQYDDSGQSDFEILEGDDHFRIMADVWGLQETVDLITTVATQWRANGKQELLIGDLSLFHGGDIPQHSTHEEGKSADIDSSIYCSINQATFDPVQALELVDLFKDEGAAKMYLNCHHTIQNNSRTEWASGHHHHLHIYSQGTNPTRRKTSCNDCAVFNTCQYKILKVAKKGVANSEENYNPNTNYNGESNDGLVYRIPSAAGNNKYYVTETASPD